MRNALPCELGEWDSSTQKRIARCVGKHLSTEGFGSPTHVARSTSTKGATTTMTATHAQSPDTAASDAFVLGKQEP